MSTRSQFTNSFHAIAATLALLFPAVLAAIETTDVQFRSGSTNDGLVVISRDAGSLRFRDQFHNTTLSQLLSSIGSHAALSGLAADDHPQYLTTARHLLQHNAAFNGDLPISGDLNGNATLGDHVADADLHLRRNETEIIPAVWSFPAGLQLGEATAAWSPAHNRVELNRGLHGSGALSGFSSIAGIAAADLPSVVAPESIAAPWSFEAGAEVSGELVLRGLASVRLEVHNGHSSAIAAGAAVRWKGLSGGRISAEPASGAPIGFAASGGASGAIIPVVLQGVVSTTVAAGTAAGDELGWSGGMLAPGATPVLGVALEPRGTSGSANVWLFSR
jgi:hypothetical protein